jgi:hypothetical protein
MKVLVQGGRVQGEVDGNGERIGSTDSRAVPGPAGRQTVEVTVPATKVKSGPVEPDPSSFIETPASSSNADETAVNEVSTFPAEDDEPEGDRLHDNETHEGHAEGDGHGDESAVALDDAGEAHDAADPDDVGEADDDEDSEEEVPQPLPVVELPEDFDWRKLRPRAYGKSLPPLDPLDRQSLEDAIVSHGILHKILIDDLSNIIDGGTRWEICLEKGIAPPVVMVSGLTEEEKEELAISSNVDRRQLKDRKVERQVREVRFENMFKLREKNPKKWTLKRIARVIGVSVATVSLRWRERQNSKGENASIVDARQLYGDDLKSEAVRLVEMGMPVADVPRLLPISRKAVERAVKKAKELEAGKAPAKAGKGKKAAAAESAEDIEDIAASDGVPELHRRALERLDLPPKEYACLDEECRDQAQQDIEKISTDDAELVRYDLYGKYLMDFAQELLEQRCRSGAEEDVVEEAPGASSPDAGGYEADEVLDGAVHVDEPDVALVSLPTGDRGAIAEGDTGVTRLAVTEKGDEARARVNGFDPEAGQPDRESMAQDDRTRAAEPNLDDRASPYEKHFGRKGEPKK